MKVFISYSTDDKTIAGQLHDQMVAHGLNAFLAHESIEVSADWKADILSELSAANAMIVLLSKAYRGSEWTDHELGYYYARTNHAGLIIPIILDGTKPYGFFAHKQGQPLAQGARCVPLELWLRPLLDVNPDQLIPVVIEKLRACNMCRTCEAYMRVLTPHFKSMPQASLDLLLRAASANPCFYSASKCRSIHLPKAIAANAHRLTSAQIAVVQGKLDADESFTERVVLAPSTLGNGG